MTADNLDHSNRWKALALCIGLCLALSTAYLVLAFRAGDGGAAAPLEDSYTLYQHARQIAQGAPWQAGDGDPPLSGRTSLLYPWMLAGLYRLGAQDALVAGVAMGSGVLWLLGIVLVAGKAWDALAPSASHPVLWRTVARLAVLLTGIVQWAAFTGLETGLLTLLLLLALNDLLRRHPVRAALWLGLAGLTRPEGLIASLAACVAYAVVAEIEQREAEIEIEDTRPARWRRIGRALLRTLPLFFAVLIGLAPSIVHWTMTGTPALAGIAPEAWRFDHVWRMPARTVRILRLLNGWDKSEIAARLVAPGLTVLALAGWIALARRRQRLALLATASWFGLGMLCTALWVTSTGDLSCYQAPFVPIAVLVALAGTQLLWEDVRTPRFSRLVGGAMLIWLVGGSLPTTYYTLAAFRQMLSAVVR